MSADFLGTGWAFPVQLAGDGTVARAAYEDAVHRSVWIILETAPGERVMRPDFGCGIHDMIFEVLDSTTLERIRSEVSAALRRYEARVEVLGVTVDEDASLASKGDSPIPRQGVLMVEVEYQVRRTNQIGNLVFPFYVK